MFLSFLSCLDSLLHLASVHPNMPQPFSIFFFFFYFLHTHPSSLHLSLNFLPPPLLLVSPPSLSRLLSLLPIDLLSTSLRVCINLSDFLIAYFLTQFLPLLFLVMSTLLVIQFFALLSFSPTAVFSFLPSVPPPSVVPTQAFSEFQYLFPFSFLFFFSIHLLLRCALPLPTYPTPTHINIPNHEFPFTSPTTPPTLPLPLSSLLPDVAAFISNIPSPTRLNHS